jgi:small conductance mechanosensitive channel
MSDFNMDQLIDLAMFYGIKVIMALAIYIIGKWIVGLIANAMTAAMNKRDIDSTVAKFVGSIVYYLMFAFVVIAALSQLGVQTASVVAILGAAGLAVGFALQGTLSNFAAGVMIIILRPIKVGDFVEVAGAAGVVSEVAIFATTLHTGDNKTVIIANSSVMGSNIINYSTQSERRVDLIVGVGYDSNIQQVKDELKAIAESESRILHDKGITIGVSELADSSVNLVFRSWVKSADYWAVFFHLNERVKTRFDEVGIEIPYPQMHVHSNSQAA